MECPTATPNWKPGSSRRFEKQGCPSESNVRLGSKPEVRDTLKNFLSWGQSRRNREQSGHRNFECLLLGGKQTFWRHG